LLDIDAANRKPPSSAKVNGTNSPTKSNRMYSVTEADEEWPADKNKIRINSKP